jgi:hypothetical protein
MELKDFISSSIEQIVKGVMEAKVKCQELDVVINPDITIGSDNNQYIPIKGTYSVSRRVQMIEMDISVAISESEGNKVDGKVGIHIFAIGANTSDSKGSLTENRIRF